MRRFRWVAILAAALALLAAACTKSSNGQTQPTSTALTGAPEPTETATGEPTGTTEPTEEPSPTPSEEPAILANGRHFLFPKQWDNLEDGSGRLTFDLAYFLTGEEANQAAAAHGDETPVPDDYYIVNDNPKLRQLPVAADAKIRVIDWNDCCELKKLDMLQFGSIMVDGDPSGSYRGIDGIYWITVKDETIVKIEEQYTP